MTRVCDADVTEVKPPKSKANAASHSRASVTTTIGVREQAPLFYSRHTKNPSRTPSPCRLNLATSNSKKREPAPALHEIPQKLQSPNIISAALHLNWFII